MSGDNSGDGSEGSNGFNMGDLVQELTEGPNRFERLVEEGKTDNGNPIGVDLDDAKYLLIESGGEVTTRYHHEKGLDRKDVEGIDAIRIGEDGEPVPFDVEPTPNYESATLGPGTAALVLETAVSYPNELELDQRRMDFTYLVNDYFEHGDDIVTDRGAEGSETKIGLTIEGGDENLRYKLEVPLESATQERQKDGSYAPQVKRSLAMEGEI